MIFKLVGTALLSLALASPTMAQTAPDDVHCFFLSNFFAKTEKNEKRRTLAGQATMFYLGKIEGRTSAAALAAAMTARLDPQAAGPQMTACAQRLGRAEMTLQQTLTSVAPKH